MTQHINLLQQRRRPIGAALAALAVMLILLLGLLAYGAVLHSHASALRQHLASSAQELQQTKAALLALGAHSAASADAASVRAEIAGLQSRLLLAQKWAALVDNDSLGTPAGYVPQFKALGSVSEDGLWLTRILVSDSGKQVNLGGRSFSSAAVLRYAEKLNAAFGAQGLNGVRFNSLEMTPEDLVGAGPEGAPSLHTVGFSLF